jgi:hypothetical protein
MNSYAEIEYIRSEYMKQGILNNDGMKISKSSGFDYCIYPWEKGYIPKCDVCSEMFVKSNGENRINAPHKHCGCLWFNWYKRKILKTNQNVNFI